MQRERLMALAAAAALSGCAASDYGRDAAIPLGSELVVHQRLPLGSGGTRVYMQDGEIVPQGDVDRFRVACFLRIQRRGDEPLTDTIRPGRLLAIEDSRSWARGNPGDDGIGLDHGRIERPVRLDYFTEVEIRSDLQPQVDELQCRYNGHTTTDDAPGWTVIQQALGKAATLEPPAAGAR